MGGIKDADRTEANVVVDMLNAGMDLLLDLRDPEAAVEGAGQDTHHAFFPVALPRTSRWLRNEITSARNQHCSGAGKRHGHRRNTHAQRHGMRRVGYFHLSPRWGRSLL